MNFKDRFKEDKAFFIFLLICFVITLIVCIILLSQDYFRSHVPQSNEYKELIKDNIKQEYVKNESIELNNTSMPNLTIITYFDGTLEKNRFWIALLCIITITGISFMMDRNSGTIVGLLVCGLCLWMNLLTVWQFILISFPLAILFYSRFLRVFPC